MAEESSRDAPRDERVFMLRIWRETGTAEATRGSVVELESGRRFFFSGLMNLYDVLNLRLNEPSGKSRNP